MSKRGGYWPKYLLLDKTFFNARLYGTALDFVFLGGFGEMNSFGSMKMGKFHKVGRVTKQRYWSGLELLHYFSFSSFLSIETVILWWSLVDVDV